MISFSWLIRLLPPLKGYTGMPLKQIMSILLLAATCLVQGGQPTSSANQPNFIIIYTDDMGYADAGPFVDPLINTPAIDSLVENGQAWTNFYAAASVCTPSRGALLTGKLPVRTGLYGNNLAVFYPESKKGIPTNEKTIAEVFQDNSYATGMFGKWHLGDAKSYYPTRHGFDEWVGIPYSNDMDWEVDGITLNNIFSPPWKIADKLSKVMPVIQQQIYNPSISDWQVPLISSRQEPDGTFKDIELERPADQTLITQKYTNESVRFMRESVDANKPFFLYLSHSMPHVPLFRSSVFAGKSRQGIYGDVIEEIDWSVGRILDAVEQFSITSNTYIVLTSDNGPWLMYGVHAGSATPLRDGKGTTFEGGMRVMTFFSGPGITPGLSNELGMQTDLFSTFISLAGFTKSQASMDSFDLSDSLKKRTPSPRTFVPFYKGSELRAFRLGNHKIQYVTQGAYGMPPARQVHDSPLLIDLINDPNEGTDVSEQNPQIVSQIDAIAREFEESIDVKPSILDSQYSKLLYWLSKIWN